MSDYLPTFRPDALGMTTAVAKDLHRAVKQAEVERDQRILEAGGAKTGRQVQLATELVLALKTSQALFVSEIGVVYRSRGLRPPDLD